MPSANTSLLRTRLCTCMRRRGSGDTAPPPPQRSRFFPGMAKAMAEEWIAYVVKTLMEEAA